MLAELKVEYEKSPDSIDTNRAIADYYLDNGMEDKAEPYLAKMLDIDENIASAHNQLGVIYFGRRQYDKSEKHFKKALQLDFNSGETHFNLGFLYQTAGKFDQALSHYKEAINLDGQDPETYRFMGQCAHLADMLSEAEVFFAESFRLAPSGETAMDLSMIYITEEKYEDAENVLLFLLDLADGETSDENTSVDLNEESLHFALGLVLAKQGKYMNAIKHLRQTVMIDDRNEQAYNYLGECCAAIGLDKEAESFLSKASKLDLQYLQPIMNLGKLYYEQEKYQKAAVAIEQYLSVKAELEEAHEQSEQDSEAEYIYELLGMAYRELGQKAKAREVWQESLTANPDQPRIISLMEGSPSPVYRKKTLSIDD